MRSPNKHSHQVKNMIARLNQEKNEIMCAAKQDEVPRVI
jgi:hypothetical protein